MVGDRYRVESEQAKFQSPRVVRQGIVLERYDINNFPSKDVQRQWHIATALDLSNQRGIDQVAFIRESCRVIQASNTLVGSAMSARLALFNT